MADPWQEAAPSFQWPRHFNKTESSAEVCGAPGTRGSSGPLTCPCQVILTSPREDRSDRRRRGSTGEQRNDGVPQRVPESKWEFFWRPELHVALARAKMRATDLLALCGGWERERESDGWMSPPPAGSGAAAERGGTFGWVHLLVLPNCCRYEHQGTNPRELLKHKSNRKTIFLQVKRGLLETVAESDWQHGLIN